APRSTPFPYTTLFRSVRQHAGLAGDEQHLQERVAKAVESRRQLAAARARGEVARELGLLLGANNFQTYLLEGAMKVLTEDGSVRSEEHTSELQSRGHL